MKYTLFFFAAFFVVISPVHGALTSQDLDKIRLIVKEETTASEARLRAEIAASETRMKEYVDTKFEGVNIKFEGVDTKFKEVNTKFDIKLDELDKRMILVVGFVTGLIILIVVTVGIPQIIMAWRGRNERAQDKKIEELSREIEALKQRHIVSP